MYTHVDVHHSETTIHPFNKVVLRRNLPENHHGWVVGGARSLMSRSSDNVTVADFGGNHVHGSAPLPSLMIYKRVARRADLTTFGGANFSPPVRTIRDSPDKNVLVKRWMGLSRSPIWPAGLEGGSATLTTRCPKQPQIKVQILGSSSQTHSTRQLPQCS